MGCVSHRRLALEPAGANIGVMDVGAERPGRLWRSGDTPIRLRQKAAVIGSAYRFLAMLEAPITTEPAARLIVGGKAPREF